MKIQYASDLHLEFADNWRFLKENPLQVTADILVLAGYIGYLGDENYSKHPFWDWASENYQQVIACMGNLSSTNTMTLPSLTMAIVLKYVPMFTAITMLSYT